MAVSLTFVQLWSADYNLKDGEQANYLLWIEFLGLITNMRSFVNLFAHCYAKVLILDGCCNSFCVTLRLCGDGPKAEAPNVYYSVHYNGVRK